MNRSRQLSGYRGMALALVLLCAQGLLLAHTINHEHAGAKVPVCVICIAADVSVVPESAPGLPAVAALGNARIRTASVMAAASRPDATNLPRAPPSQT